MVTSTWKERVEVVNKWYSIKQRVVERFGYVFVLSCTIAMLFVLPIIWFILKDFALFITVCFLIVGVFRNETLC